MNANEILKAFRPSHIEIAIKDATAKAMAREIDARLALVVPLPPKPDDAPNITRATHCPVIGN